MATTASERRVPNRWAVLVVLSIAQLMDIIDTTIVNIALPNAQSDLGFTDAERQWVITGYALAFGSLLLLGGRLADKIGRKRLFLVGVAGFAIASAIGGAASGIGVLLVARIGQGAFAAMLAPAALSLLSLTFADNPRDRGKAFGIFGAISGAGGAVGLLLGGVLTEYLSWRWCLYVNIIIAVIALVGGFVLLRDSPRTDRTPLDWPGTLTAIGTSVALVYGLANAATNGWASIWTLAPLIAGILLLIAFVLIERNAPHPLLPLSVVLDRVRGAAYLTVAFTGVGMFAIFLFLTYYMEQDLRFTPIQAGAGFLPMIAMVMVGAVISGTAFVPRTGPRPLVPAGALLAAVGLALLTGIGTDTSYAGSVLPGIMVTGLGFGFIFGPVQNAATSRVHEHHAGVASAMVNTAQQLGGSLGTALFTAIFTLAATNFAHHGSGGADATISSYHLVFWIGAGVFAFAAVLAGLLFPTGPIPEPEDLTADTTQTVEPLDPRITGDSRSR